MPLKITLCFSENYPVKLSLNNRLILEDLMKFRFVVNQQHRDNATPMTGIQKDSAVL